MAKKAAKSEAAAKASPAKGKAKKPKKPPSGGLHPVEPGDFLVLWEGQLYVAQVSRRIDPLDPVVGDGQLRDYLRTLTDMFNAQGRAMRIGEQDGFEPVTLERMANGRRR